LPDPLEPGGPSPAQRLDRRLRQALCAAGLQETCGFSLVAAGAGRVALANPLLADYGHLRDDLHSELLQAARRNLQASRPGFWAFEIGRVFAEVGGVIEERERLAGVIAGERRSELWSSSGKARPADYFLARGVLQAGLDPLLVPVQDRPLAAGEAPDSLLHPGRGATLVVEGRPIGWFGQLHPARSQELDLPEATYLFEIKLQELIAAASRPARLQPAFRTYPTVPASERDLALVVEGGVTAADLLQAIRKAGKPLLEQAELIDRYVGEPVKPGFCSQAFRLRYRNVSRTLTEAEVEEAHGKVRQSLELQFAAELRS
jgi:phenylalanyl-tRNA synthetase beta chain